MAMKQTLIVLHKSHMCIDPMMLQLAPARQKLPAMLDRGAQCQGPPL